MRLHLSPPCGTARAGMTLIEVMISFLVLTVASFMLSSTITASIAHTEGKRERALAAEAAMNTLEAMKAKPLSKLFALYNQDPSDDPDGPGTAPGAFFDVQGLTAMPSANPADPAIIGEIIMPAPGPELYENSSAADLGMPRDLNGDLAIRITDVASSYQVLPVIVRVTWSSRGAPRSIEMPTLFSSMEKVR